MNSCVIVQVDDEQFDIDFLKRALLRAGFQGAFFGFSSMEEAQAFLEDPRSPQPQIVVVDGHLRSGSPVTDFFQLLPSACHVIAYTGDTSPRLQERLTAAGASRVLHKGVDLDSVAEAARVVLELCGLPVTGVPRA
jgi:CheY-like chemotaxis protein